MLHAGRSPTWARCGAQRGGSAAGRKEAWGGGWPARPASLPMKGLLCGAEGVDEAGDGPSSRSRAHLALTC